ncbi:MAG: catechol 1,2-dioxygenase [Deltaproteobacteria bacterium]|nr:catechol 1,2-dioxygenase [Deltaproteobacteria bacterium]
MGKIVGATLCSHVPRLMIPPEKRRDYMGGKISTFYEALERMQAEQIHNRRFDTFLVFDTHWWTTLEFVLNAHGWHVGRYTSDEIPWMITDLPYDYPGDPELADQIGEEAKGAGVPVYVAREKNLPWHYPTLNTMKYLNPERRPVLPISVAYTSSVEEELLFGEAIRRAIEKGSRNVLLVATGGLSHRFWELDKVRQRASADPSDIYSEENRRYDEKIICYLKEGRHREVIEAADDFRKMCSPEGRFAHYLRMVGALGGKGCHLGGIQYGEYEAAIGTGQVNLWFNNDIPSHTLS